MSVRNLIRTLAERALQPQYAGPEQTAERLTDALAALRLLMDNWDELIRSRSLGHSSSSSSSTSRRVRREEADLLSLLSAHRVMACVADKAGLGQPSCPACRQAFLVKDDVLVYSAPRSSRIASAPPVATHLRCRWWWWDSPDSPIRPPP